MKTRNRMGLKVLLLATALAGISYVVVLAATIIAELTGS